MTVKQLIEALQFRADQGRGDLEVYCYDLTAQHRYPLLLVEKGALIDTHGIDDLIVDLNFNLPKEEN